VEREHAGAKWKLPIWLSRVTLEVAYWQLVLGQLHTVSLAPTAITYNSALGACQRAAEWHTAVHLLGHMQEESMHPDHIAFNSVIAACGGARWPLAIHLIRRAELESLR